MRRFVRHHRVVNSGASSGVCITRTLRLAIVTLPLFAIVCVLSSCGDLKARQFAPRNPTSYVFERSLTEVRLAMERAFRLRYYRDLNFVTYDNHRRLADSILNQSSNRFDGVLLHSTRTLGPSPVYVIDGEPVEYLASFHIHLVPIAEREIRADVRALNPEVIVGEVFTVHGFAYRFRRVEPTSIEEYQILLVIGEQLDVHDMPALRIPVRVRRE